MGMSLILGVMVGFCFFSALNHFFVGARGERGRAHRMMGACAAAAGLYVFCSIWLFSATDVETLKFWNRIQGAVACLVVAATFRFAHEMLGGWNRTVMQLIMAGLAAVGITSLLLPAGIFYGDIVGLRYVDTPSFGRVTLSRATSNPVLAVFDLLVYTPLLFIAVRAVQQFIKGNRKLAIITFIAIALPALPAIIDTFVLGVDTFPAPVGEAGLSLGLIFLSMVISEDVARAAGLREQLVGSEVRHRWLVETAPEAIGLYDASQRRFVLFNSRAEKLFGRTARDMTNADALDLLYRYTENPEARVETARALMARALNGEESVLEWPVSRPDGTRVPCELRIANLGTDGNSMIRVSLLDIRERKAREAERHEMAVRMRRSEKLQTIGTLADGIAHDFNNLLMPIFGFGELAAEQLNRHDALLYVREMQASAKRARDIVRQILPFLTEAESRDSIVTLQPVVKQALRFLRAAIPPRIELEIALDAPQVRIRGDATRVHQIVMNLGLNAAHATGEEGTLRVALQREDEFVELRFSDSGHGMSPDTVKRIFDPFFTTKEGGQGTGLGLSIVREIVNSWSGSIEVQSAPGEGTMFSIRLPVVTSKTAVEAPVRPYRRGLEAVLLLDKDQASLMAVAGLLESLGYEVNAYRDPQSALRSLHEQSYEVCLIDFDMAGMSPRAFADQLHNALPGVPVILTSGSGEGLSQQPLSGRPWFALAKPFGRAELSDALRAVLDGAEATPATQP